MRLKLLVVIVAPLQFIVGGALTTALVLVQVRANFVHLADNVPKDAGVPVIGYVTTTLWPATSVILPLVSAGEPVGVPTVMPLTPLKTTSAAAKAMVAEEKELFVILTLYDVPESACPLKKLPCNPLVLQSCTTVALVPPLE